MSLDSVRLTYRLYRFSILGLGLIALGACLVAFWYAIRIDQLAEAKACAAIADAGQPDDAAFLACRPFFALTEEAGRVIGAMALLPLVAGALLGVPIVAQELDRGTALLSWWLEPSRWRWLIHRALPVVAFSVAIWVVAGTALDLLESRLVLADPGASFHNYGLRGHLLAARATLLLACGVLVGATLGRVLPAIVLSIVIGAALVGGVSQLHRLVLFAESAPVETPDGRVSQADLVVDAGARLPTGEDLTYSELRARYPNPGELFKAQQESIWITWVVPAHRYPIVAGREALGTAGLGLVIFALAVPIVSRRRSEPGRVRVGLGLPRRRRAKAHPSNGKASPRMLTAARLIFWPHRSEIVAAVGVGLAASIGAAVLLMILSGLSAPAHCIEDRFLVPVPEECASAERFLAIAGEWGGRLFALMAVLPWIVGGLIGVVIVGREVEHRTTTLSWALTPDRTRWLMVRVVGAAALVILLLAVPSVVATEAERAIFPWAAPENSFNDYALRGPLVMARGILALVIGLLVGAIIGRVVPALLLTATMSVGFFIILGVLLPFGQPQEELGADPFSGGASQPLIGYSIPGERLREVELREGLFILTVSIVLVAATTAVVERRRPT